MKKERGRLDIDRRVVDSGSANASGQASENEMRWHTHEKKKHTLKPTKTSCCLITIVPFPNEGEGGLNTESCPKLSLLSICVRENKVRMRECVH